MRLHSGVSSLQVISFQEPVTLDFLDAELEDENKEEVSFYSCMSCVCTVAAVYIFIISASFTRSEEK